MNYTIRHAKPYEADELTKLAVLSKSLWGYPKKWIDAWIPELTITPEIIEHSFAFVAEENGQIIGFWCRQKISPDTPTLGNSDTPTFGFLFIHPEHMGQGVAKALWAELSKELIQHGIKSVTIIADPNAVPFYLKIGAVQIGTQESKTIPGRKIPILKITLK